MAPTLNPKFGPPRKKVYVPHFLGKNAKKGYRHKLLRGHVGGKKRGPKQEIFGHKKFSLLFSLALALSNVEIITYARYITLIVSNYFRNDFETNGICVLFGRPVELTGLRLPLLSISNRSVVVVSLFLILLLVWP